MFYDTYDEIKSYNTMNRYQSAKITQDSDVVYELFYRCLAGKDKVYAKVLEQTEHRESPEDSSGIYISLITENMLKYDENMFIGEGENLVCQRKNEELYKPYIIEFAVDMKNLTQETYRRLTDADIMGVWFEAFFSGNHVDDMEDIIEADGIVMTSASPFKFHKMQIYIKTNHVANHITRWTKHLYNTSGAIKSNANINSLLSFFFSATDYGLFIYNVGDGNCIYIKGNDGKRILFDIGHNYNPYSEDWSDPDIRRSQQAIRQFKPHGIILSHWDMDHLIGVMFSNDFLYTKEWIAPDPNILPQKQLSVNAARIAKYLESRNILNLVDSSARNSRIYNGSEVCVWCGQGKISEGKLTEANNAGLIIEFESEKKTAHAGDCRRALLSGDCEYLAFPTAMGFSKKTYETLVVPHHGSQMITTNISSIKKGIAVISVSPRNKIRPNIDHMDDLKAKGYSCCLTQQCCIEIPSVWRPYYSIR